MGRERKSQKSSKGGYNTQLGTSHTGKRNSYGKSWNYTTFLLPPSLTFYLHLAQWTALHDFGRNWTRWNQQSLSSRFSRTIRCVCLETYITWECRRSCHSRLRERNQTFKTTSRPWAYCSTPWFRDRSTFSKDTSGTSFGFLPFPFISAVNLYVLLDFGTWTDWPGPFDG